MCVMHWWESETFDMNVQGKKIGKLANEMTFLNKCFER